MAWVSLILGIALAIGVIFWCIHELRDLSRIERESEENARAFHALVDPIQQYLDEGNPWDEETWQAWNRRRREIRWQHRLIGYSIVALVYVLLLVLPDGKEQTP